MPQNRQGTKEPLDACAPKFKSKKEIQKKIEKIAAQYFSKKMGDLLAMKKPPECGFARFCMDTHDKGDQFIEGLKSRLVSMAQEAKIKGRIRYLKAMETKIHQLGKVNQELLCKQIVTTEKKLHEQWRKKFIASIPRRPYLDVFEEFCSYFSRTICNCHEKEYMKEESLQLIESILEVSIVPKISSEILQKFPIDRAVKTYASGKTDACIYRWYHDKKPEITAIFESPNLSFSNLIELAVLDKVDENIIATISKVLMSAKKAFIARQWFIIQKDETYKTLEEKIDALVEKMQGCIEESKEEYDASLIKTLMHLSPSHHQEVSLEKIFYYQQCLKFPISLANIGSKTISITTDASLKEARECFQESDSEYSDESFEEGVVEALAFFVAKRGLSVKNLFTLFSDVSQFLNDTFYSKLLSLQFDNELWKQKTLEAKEADLHQFLVSEHVHPFNKDSRRFILEGFLEKIEEPVLKTRLFGEEE